jgi:Family of unknown function (DUF5908)
MTLEISEIGIRLAVGEPSVPSPAVRPPSGDGAGGHGSISPAQTEEIVQACVREVLRTLRMLGER